MAVIVDRVVMDAHDPAGPLVLLLNRPPRDGEDPVGALKLVFIDVCLDGFGDPTWEEHRPDSRQVGLHSAR